ncbi:TPA: GNAT family N-acetyltransferase [Clostridioides difficile]|uniref:GNAT family N-acetyltransferase n=1 Tax=Clostridioides difficile TaxID=1496 RepID=UPI00093FACCF|nr:GNAT family N-acetyltransferase [Clostridioides difficile]MBY2473445.1 GNAT family N-acetyltransferase [Clostridioides difficile]MBZ0513053.1 GNAT family N-acetyltransferase [Clostridioides difficile]MCW0885163.1 GNAT family N-acetyltransferase [Clostridioides difficile]MDM9750869.1 GNAT family N-acetyltransferase [Clostridioides difficile]MDM9780752.1 GNAT family N-acetyltransferase [Clostridioides difficile]
MIEGIKFIKAEEKYIYSYWKTFDKIAKERKYLAMDEAFPFEETVEFIKNTINKNLPQLFIIDLESDNCIGWCDVLPKTEKVGYLGMGILKEYREKGIGSSLLKQIIDLSKEYGYEKIELDVFKSNSRAIHVYKSLGFVEVNTISSGFTWNDRPVKEEVIQMELTLI